jgi:hypothetical protein
MATPDKSKAPSQRTLQEQLRRAQTELTLAETKYTTTLLDQLTKQEANFSLRDADEDNWIQIGSGGISEKDFAGMGRDDPALLRKRAYWFWRTNPHARGIIRNFERFIIGREFAIDFEDTQRGTWNVDRTHLVPSEDEEDPLILRELWDDFAEVNMFTNRMKEVVRRTFRDGGAFVQKFDREGFITLRFIEAARVQGNGNNLTSPGRGAVRDGDVEDVVLRSHPKIVGKPTKIVDGIEYLAEDPETIVAYHVGDEALKTDRIPARDVIQTKPYADFNDQRGLLLLEVVMRHLASYAQWEDYRMVLNKVRTAVALVRKVDGTATQANAIIAGRGSTRPGAPGTEPQTLSGRREAMPKAGTIITAGPGVDWEFKRPNLDARDASEDGRRILLSVSAGAGLPEMLVTGDWCHSWDTDVLTDRGWLPFDQVTYGDHLGTVNAETGTPEFQKPQQLHSFHYQGEMVTCFGPRTSFCVTPRHDMWVASPQAPTTFRKVPAGALTDPEYLLPGGDRLVTQDLQRRSYDGVVWCATVPNGLLITRYRGTVLISGNSNSNYSSSVESRTPAVREWEDWQEFFEPVIKRIVHWVVEAAKDKLKLPQTISGKIAIQWPSIISKDSDKETNRYAVLNAHGVMSKKTWGANEGLIYDEEIQNFREEADADLPLAMLGPARAAGPPPNGRPEGPDPQPGMPRSPRPSQSEARAQLVTGFTEIQTLVEQLDAPEALRTAVAKYTAAVNAILTADPRASA